MSVEDTKWAKEGDVWRRIFCSQSIEVQRVRMAGGEHGLGRGCWRWIFRMNGAQEGAGTLAKMGLSANAYGFGYLTMKAARAVAERWAKNQGGKK